jgi:hypothetical protein
MEFDNNEKVYKYVKDAEIKIYNDSWDCYTRTNVMGFAYPNATGSTELQLLTFGNYTIEVTWKGQTKSITYELSNDSNKTITFYFNEPDKPPVYANITTFPEIYLAVSYISVTVILIPVAWYLNYRRKKAEEEEKRITV